jgi:hypothetical protein
MRRVLGMSLVAVAVVGSAAVALRCSGVWERLTSWGVDPTVSASVLPGDDLVVDPTAVDTRSLEIAAPLSAIWPWLVQMGDDRGDALTGPPWAGRWAPPRRCTLVSAGPPPAILAVPTATSSSARSGSQGRAEPR